MGKSSFLNQKLGKRMSRKFALLKSQLSSQRVQQRPASADPRKKGPSRNAKPNS